MMTSKNNLEKLLELTVKAFDVGHARTDKQEVANTGLSDNVGGVGQNFVGEDKQTIFALQGAKGEPITRTLMMYACKGSEYVVGRPICYAHTKNVSEVNDHREVQLCE